MDGHGMGRGGATCLRGADMRFWDWDLCCLGLCFVPQMFHMLTWISSYRVKPKVNAWLPEAKPR